MITMAVSILLKIKERVDTGSKYIEILGKFYDNATIEEKVDELYSMIDNAYDDIVKSNLQSAKHVISGAIYSKNPEAEIRHAVHYLIPAFYLSCEHRDKKKELKRLFAKTVLVDLCDNKLLVCETCLNLSLYIYELYCVLNEEKLAKEWINIAVEQLNYTLAYFESMTIKLKKDSDGRYGVVYKDFKHWESMGNYYNVSIVGSEYEPSENYIVADYSMPGSTSYFLTKESSKFISDYPALLSERYEEVKSNGELYQEPSEITQ